MQREGSCRETLGIMAMGRRWWRSKLRENVQKKKRRNHLLSSQLCLQDHSCSHAWTRLPTLGTSTVTQGDATSFSLS